MSKSIVTVSDSTFEEEVLRSSVPVLVDFWAEWCGPCKAFAPVLEEVAKEYEERLKVCKVDVDANQQSAARFGVRAIPTLMIFKDGNSENTKTGALSRKQLREFVDTSV